MDTDAWASPAGAFRYPVVRTRAVPSGSGRGGRGEGAKAAELHRTNNMALQFMMTDEIWFNAVMRTSAEIVMACPIAECERGYLDVATLCASFKDRNTNASFIEAARN